MCGLAGAFKERHLQQHLFLVERPVVVCVNQCEDLLCAEVPNILGLGMQLLQHG